MAFLSRAGSLLKHSVSKQIGVVSQISASNPSIYQALRCMSSSKLFVGGLPYSVDETGLRNTFSQYGEVIEAKVIIDREQNRSKGFGFISFASSEEASSALQAMDGQDIQGRRVRVNYATERAPRSFGGGGYGGGGYGGGQQSGGYGGQYGGGNSGGYGGGYGGGNSGGYGGQYGGGNSGGYGGRYDAGNSGGGYPSGGAAQGVATGAGDSYFGGGAAGGNVTAADTGFGSSGFEDGAGLGNGANDQFGDDSTGGDFEPTGQSEGNVGDDEPDDFVKQA